MDSKEVKEILERMKKAVNRAFETNPAILGGKKPRFLENRLIKSEKQITTICKDMQEENPEFVDVLIVYQRVHETSLEVTVLLFNTMDHCSAIVNVITFLREEFAELYPNPAPTHSLYSTPDNCCDITITFF